MQRGFVLLIFSLLLLASCNSEKEDACVFQPDDAPQVFVTFEMLQDSLVNV